MPNFYYTMYNGSVTIRIRWPLPTQFYRNTIETKLKPCCSQHSFTSSNHRSNLDATTGRPPAGPITNVPRVPKNPWSPVTTVCNPSKKLRNSKTPRTHLYSDLLLRWCHFSSTSFPFYMSWCRAQVSRPFTKWTLGSRRLNSTCPWLNRWFSTLVS